MPHNVGKKIKDFIFTNPTEEMVGLPPAPKQGHMTKSEELGVIHHALEHPLGDHHHHHHKHEEHKAEPAPHKSFGQKLKAFLFEVPTEESLGLPQVNHHPTKPEALHEIHDAFEHPFARHNFDHSK